jgi:ribosomal protein L37AE/L43A
MDKQPQATRVKHDRPICEQCQASSIKTRPDGSYRCNQCGYDSAKGKK